MIDIWEVNADIFEITYTCPDCERKYGVPFRHTWNMKLEKPYKFLNAHEKCGEACPELWTEEKDLEWKAEVNIMKSIYAYHPGISLSEAKDKFSKRKAEIDELRQEVGR